VVGVKVGQEEDVARTGGARAVAEAIDHDAARCGTRHAAAALGHSGSSGHRAVGIRESDTATERKREREREREVGCRTESAQTTHSSDSSTPNFQVATARLQCLTRLSVSLRCGTLSSNTRCAHRGAAALIRRVQHARQSLQPPPCDGVVLQVYQWLAR
jgi:hypothetical protein